MKQQNYPLYDYMPLYTDVRDMVKKGAERYGENIAYSFRPDGLKSQPITVTYRQFLDRVRAIGTMALEKGYADRHIALIGKTSFGWICTFIALLSVGVVVVPLDEAWEADDLADTVKRADCSVLFCEKNFTEKADRIRAVADIAETIYLDGNDADSLEAFRKRGEQLVLSGDNRFDTVEYDHDGMAELVFTSGTTGKGKGVMLSHRALAENMNGAFQILKVEKKTMHVLPPHHTYGSTIGILSTICNGCHTYLSAGLRYIAQEIKLEQPELLIMVPLFLETFYNRIFATAKQTGQDATLRRAMKLANHMRRAGIDIRRKLFAKSVLSAFGGKLNTIICGGAPLSQELIDAYETFGIRVINGYGITECSPLIAANRTDWRVPNSVGMPLPNAEVRIDNPTEEGDGEICVRAPFVMNGYYKDEEATAAAIDEEGFFHTGDIGRYDGEVLRITGRMKNLIILANGKNVYPEEIEAKILRMPGVVEAVVYEGISRRGIEGNAVVAEIYPDADYLAEQGIADAKAYFTGLVSDYNRDAVPYKRVGLVRIRREEFPKNTMRKITRFKLDRTID